MKVLLTGEPRSGKTTLLEGFIEDVPNKQGFVTREVREDGERVGFELVSSLGQTTTLASVNSNSQVRVSRYGVEVRELDDFLAELPPIRPGNLLYVDEIGQMELFSDTFKSLIDQWLDSENLYVGTITSTYHDDYTEQVLGRDDIILLKIAPDNREQMSDILKGLAAHIPLLYRLSHAVQEGITKMAKVYAEAARYTQLKKLFKNAIPYLAEDKVEKVSNGIFSVRGNTDKHSVKETDDGWQCDCDFFKGKGSFENNAGECSHIQASKLCGLA